MNTLHKTIRFLARADFFSYALLWLMLLLVGGTFAEKSMGLYVAQQRFFSSLIVWLWDFIPVPGTALTVGWVFIALFARLFLYPWTLKNAGTVIIHVGATLLLLGGFVTAQFSQEGSMAIPEGQSRDYIEDYQKIELAVSIDPDDNGNSGNEVVFPSSALSEGRVLSAPQLPFSLGVLAYCRNCGLERRATPRVKDKPHGVAINFNFRNLPHDKIEENNHAGMFFNLNGIKNHERDGLYAVFQNMPIPELIVMDGHKYLIDMRRTRTRLPFSIGLVKFTRSVYPGTETPRGFESEVILRDHGVEWHNLIRMNEPLRYKGYTFYQSAFETGGGMGDGHVRTVLAVVKNIGRLFPYISSIIICFGLLVHLFQRLPGLAGKETS